MSFLNFLKVFLISLLVVLALPFPVAAGETDRPKRALVLHSFNIPLPAHIEVDQGLKAGVRAAGGPPVEWETEYLDLVRFADPGYLDLLLDLLRRKYSQRRVDLVIPVFPPAIKFFLTYGVKIFSGVPVVICGEVEGLRRNLPLEPPYTCTFIHGNIAANTKLALSLYPQARRVVVVAGSGKLDRRLLAVGQENLRADPVNAPIAYLTDFSLEDLGPKIAALPQDAVIMYVQITRGNRGDRILPRDALVQVVRTAKVPVFGLWETLLGEGIVGGYLIRFEEMARKTGELAARILRGEKSEQVSPVLLANSPMFDERQLKRWGISESRLPAGSIVRFRERTLWEEHGKKIVGVILLLAFQSIMIAFLLLQRARRRRAELEARQRRDELARVSRVATVGELTSCLTHELKQPLTAIVTNAQTALGFLRLETPDFLEVEGALEDIDKEGRRSGEIMHRLRNLLKKSEINHAPVDLNEVALEIVTLVQADFAAAGVSLTHDLARNLPRASGDRIQLEQVVLNLLANGLEATKNLTGKVRTVQVITRKEDDGGVGLTVRDSGLGLSPATLDHLFEPFFTTKTGGMGMGLSISQSIIEAHGGRLWAEPNQDRGAAFRFRLPATGEPAP